MSDELKIRFMKSKTLWQADSLEKMLKTILVNNIEICELEVGNIVTQQYAYWRPFKDQVLSELDIAYEKQQLGGMLKLNVLPEFGVIILSVRLGSAIKANCEKEKDLILFYADSTSIFRKAEYYAERHCQVLLDLFKQLYYVFQPEFGWIEICGSLSPGYTKIENVDQLRVPHIYWSNFFSPSYVEKLGRDYLEKAPGWKVEFLEDGGCLYVLSPTMKAANKVFTEQIKEYWGVEEIRKKSKPPKKSQ